MSGNTRVEQSRNRKPLRVGINAQMASGTLGGVEQAVIGLAGGLSRLTDSGDEYLFLTLPGDSEWLRPYVGGPCSIVEAPARNNSTNRSSQIKARVTRLAPGLHARLRNLPVAPWERPNVRPNDPTLEQHGADVIHFPFQDAFQTTLPSVYQPWDLQHVHLPQFFTKRQRQGRQHAYGYHADAATYVSVASQWGKQDYVRHYGIEPDKVAVIPMAAPTSLYVEPQPADVDRVRARFTLPDRFLFYPAQTFPHKNHGRLIEALARIKSESGVSIPLVCSGRRNDYYPTIGATVSEAGLDNQVHFIGFVNEMELQCLYRMAVALVFPSLFEGWGLPITEAFNAGLPVACSNVTCLPEQVGDAALLFDPTSVTGIAGAVTHIWNDDAFRADLARRGKEHGRQYTWDQVAQKFRTLYHAAAGTPLTEGEQAQLSSMLDERP